MSQPRQSPLDFAHSRGTFRLADAVEHGLHPESIRRLCTEGELVRESRGVYTVADSSLSEHHGLVVASTRVPASAICLLSALQFHGIGTQFAREVWLAVPKGHAVPRIRRPPVRVFHMRADTFNQGLRTHTIENAAVRVYDPARTVADCFRFRHVVSREAALEALRETIAEHRATPAELWHYARLCRVATVMRPYLEALQ
ncbi:MAG: transcriptional regulator [Chitinivibrionales bacterium]|nr:transcriptional regulator [Chitinivibrionales bacterium]